jgi:hypothetical protein
MIESRVEFETADLRAVVEVFCSLPEELRPTRYSLGEEEPDQPIVNSEKLLDSLAAAGLGPILKGEGVTYDVGFFDGYVGEDRVKSSSIVCRCYLEREPALAEKFLLHIAAARPAFGYACLPEEHDHRHRLSKQASYGHQTAGVGNDWRRYLPGVYWLTVIPSSLAEKHGLPLEKLRAEASNVQEPTSGVWVLRFFDHPDDWEKHAERLDRLCADIPGIFSIADARPAFEAAGSFLETEDVLASWQ